MASLHAVSTLNPTHMTEDELGLAMRGSVETIIARAGFLASAPASLAPDVINLMKCTRQDLNGDDWVRICALIAIPLQQYELSFMFAETEDELDGVREALEKAIRQAWSLHQTAVAKNHGYAMHDKTED